MISAQSMYCLADRVDSLPPMEWTPDWSNSFGERTIPGLRTSRQSIWLRHLADGFEDLPDGWKIHISSGIKEAPLVLETVTEICVENGVSFKHLISTAVLAAFTSKWAPRSAAGKFAVIYPPPHRAFELAQQLHEALPQRSGPFILSDFEWSEGSSVFMRWGAFQRKTAWTPEGRRILLLEDELGTREDVRRVPASLDALPPTAREAASAFACPPLLTLDAKVTEALQFTASGGVYGGTSNGRPVIVKEARGGIDARPGQCPSPDRLRHESRVLTALEGLEGIPRVIETTEIGGNAYTVMTRLNGRPLRSWVASEHPLLHGESDADALTRYARRCAEMSSRLSAVIASVHARGIAHRDLHPGNVLVSGEGAVAVIDFETAGPLDDRTEPQNGCPGFIFSEASGRERDEASLDTISHWMLNPAWAGAVHLDSASALAVIETTRNAFGPSAAAVCDSAEARLPLLASSLPEPSPAEGNWAESRLSDLNRSVPLSPRSGRGALAVHGLASGVGGCLLGVSDSARSLRAPLWRKSVLDVDSDDPGLWDGWAGIAVCAHLLGDPELAATALQRSLSASSACTDLTLSSGLAGVMQASLTLGDSKAAFEIAARIESCYRGGSRFPFPGLESGASGVARALRSLASTPGCPPGVLALAREICEEDQLACVLSPDGQSAQIRSGRRLLPYLGTGGLGVAVALAELGAPASEWEPLAAPASWPIVLDGGVSEGRSGLTAGLLWLSAATGADVSSAVRLQRRLMSCHLVRSPDGLALAGEGGARITGDLRSGTSGWLAVESALDGRGNAAWQALCVLFGGRSAQQDFSFGLAPAERGRLERSVPFHDPTEIGKELT